MRAWLGMAFVLLLTGCVPIQYVWRPGASGTLVDSSTGAPVGGARIELAGPLGWDEARTPHARVQTVSDPGGAFKIEPEHRIWWRPLLPIPMDMAASEGTLTVSKQGYSNTTLKVFGGYGERGKLSMKPVGDP